nr:MAG TPA: major capsid protein [Caudoviricetes sp.]
MAVKCDFSGYATKNDVRCSDNKVIRHGAFAAYDGKTVPLVWQHKHGDVENVLGHADLEVREDGVYAYAHLNNTDRGRTAREMVKNGDIKAMSIYATHVRARGNDVCPRRARRGEPGAPWRQPGCPHRPGLHRAWRQRR